MNSDQLSVNSGDTVHCPLFTDYCSLVTDIYLPFSLLGITDPTAAALKLVAFATEEDGLRLWAAMPDKNPLNSPRVLNPVAAAFAPSDLTLTQHYAWSSLSSGVLPNQGQFVDTDVRVTITPSQPAVQAAYLADQFFGLLTPDQRLDANLDGQPDVSLPQDEQPFPLHAGQTVNYTVVYTNAGTVPATGTELDLRAYGALRFGGGSTTSVVLPAIAPGGSGTLQFSATADGSAAAGEINAVLTDATHGAYDWVWLLHPVDIAPPEGLAITLPERLAHPSLNIVTGVAHDAAGVPTIELEVKALPSGVTTTITCPQAFPDDGTWSCQWDAGKSTNVDWFELRARATDRFGNVSAWTGPRPVDFDDTPPVVTLEPQVELALLAPSMPQGELLLRGELQDDFQVGELAICVDQSYGPGCSQVTVTSGTGVTGTWASTLLVTEQGDGLTHTLALYGTDGVGNRMTEPLTRTYTVDTVPPALAVTSVVTTPVASLTGTVSDGGGVSEVYIRVAQPDGTSYSAIARRDGTAWAYTLVPKQAGLHLLTVEAADRAGNISRQEVPITITSVKVTPTILWDNPADIVYGTALSETQLNATAEFNDVRVSGVFAYTPPAGTVLNAGDNQTLHVDFTPDDTANYTGASKDVTINVLKASASITITLDDLTQMYDGTPKAVTVETSPLALSGVTVSYNGSPTAPTDPGEYTVIASLDNLNYWAPDATGTLVIAPREATVTYTGETVIPAGSTLDLAATVVQTSTGTLADLALAQVRYDVKSTDGTLVGTVVGNVDQASASTATLDGLSTNVYVIEVTVVGGYFTSPPESALLAVYDPSGGFVTGGGWIISPPGAYVADPTLTGRANFAFVSKYKKGADVPTGVTSFEFQTAGLKFHSDSYEWLVVAGARAQYKGSGTINGAGDFGFMLTAIDGQIKGGGGSDKFRIKIWDKNNGDTIVYDNQIGDDDDADPTTVIGGGSIVIHAR
ncbi:MAG TPA: hypothetical protein DEP84_18070 [Chloroflexi bacterium]|nr:hypothetical protein [Chloroflexota bacterium]